MKEILSENLFENLPIWKFLNNEEKEIIKEKAVKRCFTKGEIISDASGSCLGLIHIIKGSLRVTVMNEDGKEATLFSFKEKDTCILSASCAIHQIKFDTSIIAKEDTVVMIIDSSIVDYLMKNNIQVKCAFYELAIERLNQAIWVLQNVLFERIDKRLAQYIVSRIEETNSNTIYSTQEEIAKDISSSREVVTRMLKTFSNDDLIQIQRGAIRVTQLDRLKKIAE